MTSEVPNSGSSDQPSQPTTVERLKFWPNIGASYKYIREAVKAEGNRIRKTDPITIWLVPALALVVAVTAFMSSWLRVIFAFLAYLSVALYVVARIGIVRSMNHRQVNIVWHLLLASFLGGMLFAIAIFELLNLCS